MTVREHILAELTADLVTKIHGEPGQGDISLLEQELAEKAARIQTTEDVVGKGKKFGFLIMVLVKNKYGTVIGNLAGHGPCWKTLEAMMSPYKQRTLSLTAAKGRKNTPEK